MFAPTVAPASRMSVGTPVSPTVGLASGVSGWPGGVPGSGGGGSGATQLFGPTTVIDSLSLAVWPIESSATAVSVRAAHGASDGIVNVAVLAGGIASPTWSCRRRT